MTAERSKDKIRLEEEKRNKKDRREQERRADDAVREFMSSVKSFGESVIPAIREIKGKDKEDTLKQKKKQLVKNIYDSSEYKNFYKEYLSYENEAPSLERALIYKLRDYLLRIPNKQGKFLSAMDLKTVIRKKVFDSYVGQIVSDNIIHEVYPNEIFKFLPKNIMVDVDTDGKITDINDKLKNEGKTVKYKIEQLKRLIVARPDIENKLTQSLMSGNEFDQVGATVLTLIMNTGIRPSKDLSELKETEISEKGRTFGAVSLRSDHVTLLPITAQNTHQVTSARLDFIGKKQTENNVLFLPRTHLDKLALQHLAYYTANAKHKEVETGQPVSIFTINGQPYRKTNLTTFMSRLGFGDIDPTDFRKLKATETFFEELKKSTHELYQEILGLQNEQADQLKADITTKVMEAIDKALKESQIEVSHKQSTTTIEYYINPKVLMAYLSDGGVDRSLKDTLLGDIQFQFNPEDFIRKAREYAAQNGIEVAPETEKVRVKPTSPILVKPNIPPAPPVTKPAIPKFVPPPVNDLKDPARDDRREPQPNNSVKSVIPPVPRDLKQEKKNEYLTNLNTLISRCKNPNLKLYYDILRTRINFGTEPTAEEISKIDAGLKAIAQLK